MELVNFEIMRRPVNWFTLILMVLIAAMALHFVLKWGSGQQGIGGPLAPGS